MIIGLAVLVGIVVAVLCGITPDNVNFVIGVTGIVAVLVGGVLPQVEGGATPIISMK